MNLLNKPFLKVYNKVYYEKLCRFFGIKDQLTKDKLIGAFLLHDIQKNGIPWGERTDYEHGLIAARWLIPLVALESDPLKEEMIHVDEDLIDIIELVRDHMGIWNKPEPTLVLKVGKELAEKDIWHLIIQIADYWGSRKWCPFICNEFDS